jgi:hypothetical protein
MAQVKGEKLMLDPRTAEGFRATPSALRSLDGSKGVCFHTFTLPQDRCVRLLVKNLGRHMPDAVVKEELENLGVSRESYSSAQDAGSRKIPKLAL